MHCAVLKALHGFQVKRAQKSRGMKFFLQNVPGEVFKIFRMFENNMKFTKAACQINSKISKRDKNTTLVKYLLCHYCWLLLWCNYWKPLKSYSHLPKTLLYLLQWKPFKIDDECFLFHLNFFFSRYLNFCVEF